MPDQPIASLVQDLVIKLRLQDPELLTISPREWQILYNLIEPRRVLLQGQEVKNHTG